MWDPGDGSDTVEGRRDTDTMAFNGSPQRELPLSANGRRTRLTRDVGAITMDFTASSRRRYSLGGNDAFTVDDLAGTKVRTVNDDEAAVLGGAAPDAGNDQTIVNATNAPDTIVAAGAGSAAVTGLAATVNTVHADAAAMRS